MKGQLQKRPSLGFQLSRFRFSTVVCLASILAGLSSFHALAAQKTPKVPMTSRIPPGQPEIFTLEPRGIQRGVTAKVKLTGTNLAGITDLVLHNPKLQCRILDEPTLKANEAWIQITAATNVARGAYELSVKNTNNESSKLKIYVDDLPQIYQSPSLPVHSAISAFQPPF